MTDQHAQVVAPAAGAVDKAAESKEQKVTFFEYARSMDCDLWRIEHVQDAAVHNVPLTTTQPGGKDEEVI